MKTLIIFALLLIATTALASPKVLTKETPSVDGLKIRSSSTGSTGPVLVLVHGWSCDSTYWQAQVDSLKNDYRLITIDLAGHGQSQAGRKVYTIDAFSADVVAVLQAWDVHDVILVGHSMAGAVITEAALAAPDRVRGLIGVDNFQNVDMKLNARQVTGYVSTFDRDFVGFTNQWVRAMFPAGADSALVDEIATDMASAPAEVALSAMEELLYWYGGKATTELVKLNVPLMCINSDKIPTDEPAMRAILPNFQVRYVKGVGHFLFREDPAAFNRVLRETITEMTAK